jgi:transcriptional regulator with XRE-family HTH domain
MKPKEQAEARRLRRDDGLSLKEIAERLSVSKSSVSAWVRDIE